MGFLENYNYYMTDLADPRTNNWLLIGSPIPLAFTTFAYLYFVLRCGPRYMKDKRAYSCQTFIRCYNVFQIIVNALIVYNIFINDWYTDIGFGCVDYVYTNRPKDIRLAAVVWWTFILKVVDYIETGLFVLRKKDKQISFLHLYHHVTTVWISWLVVKYLAGGMSMFFGILNCSIHVVMYTYYFLSSYGPIMQQLVNPLKPLITMMQMGQFWILIAYSGQVFLPHCDIGIKAKSMALLMIWNLLMNFFLFYNFYQQSYVSKKKNK